MAPLDYPGPGRFLGQVGLFDLFQRLRTLLKQFQFLFRLVQILLLIQLSELLVMMGVKFSFRQLLRKTNLDDSRTKIQILEKKIQNKLVSK